MNNCGCYRHFLFLGAITILGLLASSLAFNTTRHRLDNLEEEVNHQAKRIAEVERACINLREEQRKLVRTADEFTEDKRKGEFAHAVHQACHEDIWKRLTGLEAALHIIILKMESDRIREGKK